MVDEFGQEIGGEKVKCRPTKLSQCSFIELQDRGKDAEFTHSFFGNGTKADV